jgi:hypothetical protein
MSRFDLFRQFVATRHFGQFRSEADVQPNWQQRAPKWFFMRSSRR